VIVALALLLSLLFTTGASGQGELPPVLDLSVSHPPVPMRADGKTHLVYELSITNIGSDAVTLSRIEVLNESGAVLARYDSGEVDTILFRPGLPPAPLTRTPGVFAVQHDARTIGGGMRAIAWMWVTIDPAATVPGSLRHRLTAETTGAGGVKRTGLLDGVRTDVHRVATPALAPPFGAGVWLAANGPSNTSLHRRTMLAVNGRARIAQRFAIDWLKIGDNGLPYRGDPRQNASWWGYGEGMLAAADGTVTGVKDGIVENVPLSKPAVPITLETVAGNHVIVEHGRGRFGLYAHLQPGSLRVKVGDRVRRGQALGRLGNSGNSDAPHLHFHLCDASSPLACEGLPYTFEHMDVLGAFELGDDLATLAPWRRAPGATPSARSRELPLENQVVQFPASAPRP
jgi:hypothetical protein